MAAILVGIIRFLHIMSAVGWVGGGLLWATIIAPNVLARGPAPLRRPFLEAALGPVTRFFISSAIATLVFGFLLMGAQFGWDFGAGWKIPTYGRYMGIGALAALVMAAHGMGVIAPSGKKLLAKMQALPPGPPSEAAQAELMASGKKLGMHGMLSVLLGTIALACMVAAVNYVR